MDKFTQLSIFFANINNSYIEKYVDNNKFLQNKNVDDKIDYFTKQIINKQKIKEETFTIYNKNVILSL